MASRLFASFARYHHASPTPGRANLFQSLLNPLRARRDRRIRDQWNGSKEKDENEVNLAENERVPQAKVQRGEKKKKIEKGRKQRRHEARDPFFLEYR